MLGNVYINAAYIFAAAFFVLGLKLLGKPSTARRGNLLSAIGMLIAIVATLLSYDIVSWNWILVGAAIGIVVGLAASRLIAMTAMPEMVAVFNGLGGGASLLVGWVALFGSVELFISITAMISMVIGGMTFSGSAIAWGKLSESITSRALVFAGQRFVNSAILIALVVCVVMFVLEPASDSPYLYAVIGLALLLGIMAVIPIGGADMPVVISLLNSYSGTSRLRRRLRHQQCHIDCLGVPGRSSGTHSYEHHVQSHEPVAAECAFQRIWCGEIDNQG